MDELGQGLIGSAGTLGSAAISKCWIAAELWGGWTDPRTVLVRSWLTEEFGRRWYGRPVLAAYRLWGERTAKAIQTKRRLRSIFQWIFNRALGAAKRWAVNDGGR
jgi:hypothetical protein